MALQENYFGRIEVGPQNISIEKGKFEGVMNRGLGYRKKYRFLDFLIT